MRRQTSINEGWEFRRCEGAGEWQPVSLPHSAVEADADGGNHWQGVCEYRRLLSAGPEEAGLRQVLWVGAAMHSCSVQLDGRELARHEGGYLSFEVDLQGALSDGREHELRLVLDNRDNASVPPGKPLKDLDFCWYGGLYRGAELRFYPALHVTDELSSGTVAGGGVFFRTLQADAGRALCSVRTEAALTGPGMNGCRVRVGLFLAGKCVAESLSEPFDLPAGGRREARQDLLLESPRLWSVEYPVLHELRVSLLTPQGAVSDQRTLRVGVRRISFSRSGGFMLNGRKVRLRGTNRHQEYPIAGYAVGPAADRRDARRIKEAGFDYVRLSHYPQSPAFLDACDELGIVVMNAIPGWQFFGAEAFRNACEHTAREVVRRDRNHACVVLWELSLNETAMDEAFITRMRKAGHEEYPGDQMYTCGWMPGFDVYIRARQHGEIHTWEQGDCAHLVSEYGDWEYYAANEGFDQSTGAGLHAAWSNSRHRRGEGERGLLQQAKNFTIALNDTLSSPAVLDGQWCMFDYARGYHPQRAACGVADSFRVPKFSWHFYRSQRAVSEGGHGWTGGPELFIASYWTEGSSLRVTVFSNCEEVELFLKGKSCGRSIASCTRVTQYLPHPPFVFDLPRYEAGELSAIGYVGGKGVAQHRILTPAEPVRLLLEVDDQGIQAMPGEIDVLVLRARVVDGRGATCVQAGGEVTFKASGPACVLGSPLAGLEAGLATVVLRVEATPGPVRLEASFQGLAASLDLARKA